MANPTTNYGWVMPSATDLVTDLPADFNVFGQGVDTSMQYLLGGTTGQVLAKTSATNMAFTWTTPQVGDITDVAVTSPITGGGSSGAVTIAIQDATTAVKGATQLTDSISSTSITTAATPNSVKTSYDLANGAIAKTTVTTAGDIIYRNATVPTRLGIGTAGQVLTVNSGATAPEWAALPTTSFPTFSAFRQTSSQSLTAGVWTKVQFNGESWDTANAFDSTTNYRFTPLTSGYYQVSASVKISGTSGQYGAFYKNGTEYKRFCDGTTNNAGSGGSCIAFFNGTTDYMEIYGQGAAGTVAVANDATTNWFMAIGIRS